MAKEAECRDDFRTLFEKCEELNSKVLTMEGEQKVIKNNIHHIVNSAKSVENNVGKFMEMVNGKPIKNEEEIVILKTAVENNAKSIGNTKIKVAMYTGGIIVIVFAIQILVSIFFG